MQKPPEGVEKTIQDTNVRLENLKIQFNLYFTGEIRVPPEKERVDVETLVRNLMSKGAKSPRVTLLLNNLSSHFSTYNNMWLKRLNELETGISTIKRTKTVYTEDAQPAPPPPPAPAATQAPSAPPPPQPPSPSGSNPLNVVVSLNREDSFDKLFDNYSRLLTPKLRDSIDKDTVINTIKSRLITSNLVDARVNLSVEGGKIKLKIKPSQ